MFCSEILPVILAHNLMGSNGVKWRNVGDPVSPSTPDEKKCPALKSKCNKCHKKGHWEHACHSKAVRESIEEVKQLYFVGEVGRETSQDDWTVSLTIGNIPVTFKITMGADATVINHGHSK